MLRWVFPAVFVLSGVLLISIPANLTNWTTSTPNAIQSIQALPLNQFIFYYLVFVSSALVTGWLFKNKASRLAVACFFAIIVLGFWSFQSLSMYEGSVKVVNNVVITTTGHIDVPQGNYLGFPALFVVGSFFSSVTGLGFAFLLPFVVFNAALLSFLLYIIGLKISGNSFLSLISAVVAIEGNVMLAQFHYHPDLITINLVLLSVFLLINYQGNNFNSKTNVMLILVLLVCVTYDFSASLVLIALLLVKYFFAKLNSEPTRFLKNIMIISIAAFITWNLFWGASIFSILFGQAISNMGNLLGGAEHIAQLYY